MENNFNLKKFLIENKLTPNSKLLSEQEIDIDSVEQERSYATKKLIDLFDKLREKGYNAYAKFDKDFSEDQVIFTSLSSPNTVTGAYRKELFDIPKLTPDEQWEQLKNQSNTIAYVEDGEFHLVNKGILKEQEIDIDSVEQSFTKFKIGDKVETEGDRSPAEVIGIKYYHEIDIYGHDRDVCDLIYYSEELLTKEDKKKPFYLLRFDHQPDNYYPESELTLIEKSINEDEINTDSIDQKEFRQEYNISDVSRRNADRTRSDMNDFLMSFVPLLEDDYDGGDLALHSEGDRSGTWYYYIYRSELNIEDNPMQEWEDVKADSHAYIEDGEFYEN